MIITDKQIANIRDNHKHLGAMDVPDKVTIIQQVYVQLFDELLALRAAARTPPAYCIAGSDHAAFLSTEDSVRKDIHDLVCDCEAWECEIANGYIVDFNNPDMWQGDWTFRVDLEDGWFIVSKLKALGAA